METVGTPYSLANGDLSSSPFPHHPSAMGPALNPTVPGTHAPGLPNGTGTTNTGTTVGTGGNAALAGHQCGGCGRVIQDRFLLYALNHYWHTGCLKCTCCQAQLGEIGKSCFERNNMILCKNDYIRLFGTEGLCLGCGQKIPASEMVYRTQSGGVYHLKCFVCVSCRQPLQQGDRYGLINGSLVCEQDYPKLAKGQGHVPLPARTSHKGFCFQV